MFLRKHIRAKDGKRYVYWTLVETYRTPRGPRQRLVAYLGDLRKEEEDGYRDFTANLNGETGRQQQELFEVLKPGTPVSIYPERLRVERVRDFGNGWRGVSLWKLLHLNQFFESRIAKGQETIRWADMICYSVVSRFCEPTSELAIAERLSQQNALCDILGIPDSALNDDRLYRTLDQLLVHKEELMKHLKQRYGELFAVDYELLLYDITSTYFEGAAKRNPQAKYGYSRDKRSDCRQVLIALVVTREGFPLSFEVFAGNRRDVTPVQEIVESIEKKYGKARRIWVMDRGMVSEPNLEWLRDRGAQYLVGTPRSWLKQFETELLEQDWREVEPGVEVRFVRSPDGPEEIFVLCRSAARREKEQGIFHRFVQRIEDGLRKLEEATSSPHRPLRNRDTLQRKIGALLKTNSRAARMFAIHVDSVPEGKSERLRLAWTKKAALNDWTDLSSGCYLLRSNISSELSPEEMWKSYIALTEVEQAFRTLKSDLQLRPIWHHRQDRTQAHIFVCFLALILQRPLEHALDRAGLGRSTRKVIEEFRSVKSMDLLVPTTTGKELRMRGVSEPEQSLRILMQHCRIQIPRRLAAAQPVLLEQPMPRV